MLRTFVCSIVLLYFIASMIDAHSHDEPVFTNVPNCLATREYMPLCASDGNSYVNRKVFQCANESAGGSLTVSHEGPCEEDDHSHDHHEHHVERNGTDSSASAPLSSFMVTTCTFALTYINLKLITWNIFF